MRRELWLRSLVVQQRRYYITHIICRSDVQGDPPIPLAELITSDNTTPSITTFLHKVKYCLVKHFYERSGPQRIETDFSWALIHACLLVFNTEDVTRYISRSWNIVHHKCSTAIIKHFTIMHICASHMIKAAKRQVESKITDPAHVDFIVRIFALLQNERDFARLTEIWTSFCTVFAGKYLTKTVKNSLETLNEMINTIGIEDYIDDTSYEETNTAELELCEVRQLRPLRLSSPFFDHFLQISLDITCQQTKHTTCSTVNGYFNPSIVELILNSYMFLVPLWSGILLGNTSRYANDMSITVGDKSPDITRDTNASVENWFKIIKKDTLLQKKRLRPGAFVRKVHPILKGRLRQYTNNLTFKVRKNKKKPPNDAVLSQEKWNKTTRQQTPRNSTKFFSPPKTTPAQRKRKTLKSRTQPNEPMERKRLKVDIDSSLNKYGLVNHANNCWLNASMQMLRCSLKKDMHKIEEVGDKLIVELYRKLFDMEESTQPSSVRQLMSVIMMDKDIQIEIGQQEDPSLFISIVLNRLERTLIFDPLITITKLECLRCRKTKCLQEEHSIFAMDIPTSKLTTSVVGCINETLKDEALTDNDAVECQVCSNKTPHLKVSTIYQPPKIIFLRLKRFTNDLRKINRRIPIELMLNIPCQYPNEYQLISILCHTGQNISSGHYWAVEPSTNAVIVYDDSNVNVKLPSYINGREIQSNAYLLAYERKDASLESGFLRGKIYLQQSDVDILKGTEWINDQLVNAYLSLLSRKYDNIAVVDSFWKEKPAFNDEWLVKEIVFFPYYTPCHWSLLVVDNAEKEIALLDPAFSTTDFSFMKTVRKMWQQKGIELKRSRDVEQEIPKQQNSHDCGPFVLLFAKMICCRQHKEIINPRKEILEDILRGYL